MVLPSRNMEPFNIRITIVQDKFLFEEVNKTDWTIWKQADQVIVKQLLFGNEKLKATQTAHINFYD